MSLSILLIFFIVQYIIHNNFWLKQFSVMWFTIKDAFMAHISIEAKNSRIMRWSEKVTSKLLNFIHYDKQQHGLTYFRDLLHCLQRKQDLCHHDFSATILSTRYGSFPQILHISLIFWGGGATFWKMFLKWNKQSQHDRFLLYSHLALIY